MHAVITEYKWPAAGAASSPSASSTTSESEPQAFAIVLKDGSTLSALTVFASYDGLHYADPDERPLLISMSKVDRAATLKLNRARNLDLYLPAAQ
jgi:glutamine synthetase type III